MRILIQRAFAALALSICVLAGCGPHQAPTQSAFAGFVDDATRDILQSSPELATQSGLTPAQVGAAFADQLDDRSALAVDLRRGGALRYFAQLRGIDRTPLSASEQITYDVLSAKFAAAAAGSKFTYGSFSALGEFSPYVLNQLDSAYISLPSFFERDVPVTSFDDGELYLRRLDRVAAALDAQAARARTDARNGVIAPNFVIDRSLTLANAFLAQAPDDMPYLKGLRAGLEQIAGALPAPPTPDTPDQARARQMLGRAATLIVTKIVPAYRRTAATLAELRARAGDEPGLWRLPHGDAYYRAALAAQTSTAMSPDQIYALGLARVKALRAELDMMLRSQGLTRPQRRPAPSAIDGRSALRLRATPEGQAAALADVRARIGAMDQRLPRWFRAIPKTRLEVRAAAATTAPSFSGGFYEAAPLDSSRAGAFILNLTSGGLNKIDLPTLVYHEAEPGHHLQISRALERNDTPILRRMIGFNEFSEGWALYAEQLADEMGIYDGDPIGRIGYLRWQMWRAARLVVDTGMHAKHWSREQAIAYLADTTGDSPGVIDTEVTRYAAMPGQACGYELGREWIVRLRDKARAALGAGFDIRDFHEAILAEGDLPPGALEARVDAWIASAKGGDGAKRAAR